MFIKLGTLFILLHTIFLVFPTISDSEDTLGHKRNRQNSTLFPDVLLRYDFTKESCINGTFPNLKSAHLPLRRNEESTICSLGLGIETSVGLSYAASRTSTPKPHLDSNGNSSNLQDFLRQIGGGGLSLEMWFRPFSDYLDRDNRLRPILTFGFAHDGGGASIPITQCDRQKIDLQIAQRGNVVEVVFRTSDTIFEPCTRFRLVDYPLRRNKINHIVVSLAEYEQQILVNGEPSPILNEHFDGSLGHWNVNDKLHLFSNPIPQASPIWYGRLYQLIVYKGFQTSSTIRSNLATLFPASQPYAIPRTITINEDAEIEPGMHNAEWYSKGPDFGLEPLPTIDLAGDSVDNELLSFLSAIGLSKGPPRTLFTYITQVPREGTLFELTEGIPLLNKSGAALPILGREVVFIPVHNAHSLLPGSTYTSFDYCVTDCEIFNTSECDSATIDIVVDAVNDPPIPVCFRDTITVKEGTHSDDESNVIGLSGFDVDSGDCIGSVYVSHEPLLGHLALSVSTFRSDGILHGTLITELNNTIAGQTAFVEYRFDGAPQVVRHDGTVTDSFQFRVSDCSGAWSTDKSVSIRVEPAVAGITQSTVAIKEDTIGLIKLRGVDNSGLRRTIGYIIESVPPDAEGFFVDSSNTRLSPNSIVVDQEEFPYVHGATLVFQPSRDFCTNSSSPNLDLTYRVVAFVNYEITSISSIVVQRMHIKCTSDPLYLIGPGRTYHVQTYEWFRKDPCSGYVFNASEVISTSCNTAAIISGIHVTSRDSHSLLAHVSLSTSHGVLTLNRNFWDDIIPLDGQEEARRSIRFLALPTKLNDVLSFLHFQSDVPGEDTISVVVHYGGGCDLGLSGYLVSDTDGYCQVLSHSITVVVSRPNGPSQKSYLFRGLKWTPFPSAIVMLLLIKFKGKMREALGYKPKSQKQDPGLNEMNPEDHIEPTRSPQEGGSGQSTRDGNVARALSKPFSSWIPELDETRRHCYYQNDLDDAEIFESPSDEFSIEVEDDTSQASADEQDRRDEGEEGREFQADESIRTDEK